MRIAIPPPSHLWAYLRRRRNAHSRGAERAIYRPCEQRMEFFRVPQSSWDSRAGCRPFSMLRSLEVYHGKHDEIPIGINLDRVEGLSFRLVTVGLPRLGVGSGSLGAWGQPYITPGRI